MQTRLHSPRIVRTDTHPRRLPGNVLAGIHQQFVDPVPEQGTVPSHEFNKDGAGLQSAGATTREGFTLIELLVGLALWLLAAVSVTHVFQSGLHIWKRTEQRAPLHQEARVVLEQMAKEFRNAIDVPGIGWSGSDRHITFATVQPAEGENAPRIIKVTYEIVPPNVLQRVKQELSPSGPGRAVVTLMTRHPTSIHWEYAYASEETALVWDAHWKRDPEMPIGIRIHLALLDETSAAETFTKTVFSPLSVPLPWLH